MSENKQDITQLRQRLAQSTILVDATHRFTSTLDSDEIQLALFEATFQIVGAQQIVLHLMNEQGVQSTICYPMEGLRLETAVLPPGATAFRICREVEQVIWHHDDADQSAPPSSVEAIDLFDSYLALPLKGADHVVGVIEAFNLLEPQNAAQQVDILAEIAGSAGLALYNGMLYQEAQQSRQSAQEYLDMQNVLHEINIELFRIDDLDELYRSAIELAHTRLGFDRVGMFLLNGTKDLLLGTYGIDAEGNICDEKGPEYAIDQKETIDDFVLNRTRLIVNEDSDLWYSGEVVGHGWHIGAAMWTEESPIGVIFADNLLTGRPLKPYQAELLFAYAGIVSNLIQRNRFDTIITNRAAEMQAVAEVSTAVATILDTDELLQNVVDLTKNRFDLYHAHIYLLNKETETLVLTSGAGSVGQQMVAEGRQIPLQQEQSLVARAARSRQGVIINDVQAEPGFLPHPLLPDTRAEMAVPLITGDRVLGVLDVQSDRLNYFTKEDISTFTTLAAQMAVALQNARLFTQSEERETLLRTIIDSTPDWIFVKDQDHRYQMVNQGYADSFHIAPQDFIGKNDLDIGFPEEIVKGNPEKGIRGFWADDVEIMESGQTKVIDIEPAVVDGEQRYLSTIKAPLKDADGQVTAVIGFVHEITDRILIEETLRQNEADLSQALKVAKLAYWEYDVEKDLFTFNDQFFALFHTTAEAHGGYQLPSAYYAEHFVYPDDLPIVGAEIERALNSTDRHYSQSVEHRILYTDGGVGYISVSINIDRDEQGNILRYYGANQDITERKQAEEALRQNEADLSEALKIAKLAYWEFDVEKDLFTFNDQFYALFHTTAEEQGGYQLSSAYYAEHFVHPDDLPMVGGEIERALKSTDRHYSASVEHRILYADGGVGYISVNITLDRDEHGNILHYAGANQDITERKLFEEALQKEQERVQVILESINVPFAVTKASDGKVIYCNEALGDLVGVPHEKLIGQGMPDFYANPSDREAYISQLREQGFVNNFDLHMKRGDSQQYWALLSGRLIEFQGEPAIITFALDVTERRKAQATIARRATELETVANVSAVAATIVDPNELLQQAVDLTKDRFNLYHAHIYLLDTGLAELILANGAGEVGQTMVTEGRQIALSQEKSLVARAARDKEGVVINDVQAEPGFLPHPLLPETRAEMAVPLIARNEVLGVLDVQADSVNHFTAEDINIFTTLAAQIAIALQNARSRNQSEQAVKELQELSRRLTREGWQEYFNQRKDKLAFGYDQQQKVSVSEIEPDRIAFPKDAHLVTQPLQIQGESIGQLRLEISEQYGEDEAELLTAVSERLSAHLENLRLAETSEQDRAAAEKRSQEMEVINEIVTQISTSLDLQHSLQIVVDELATAVNVDQVRIALIQPDKQALLVIAEHFDSARATSAVGLTIPLEGNELTLEVINTRQMVIVEDAQNSPRTEPVHDLFRAQGIETVILLPLVVNDEVIGTVGMDILDKRPVRAASLKLAETIVFQTATAIQNARLFEQIQSALAESEMLYSYSSQLNTATSLDAVLDSAVAPGFQVGATDALLLVYDRNTVGNPEYAQIAAVAPRDNVRVGESLYLPDQPVRHLWPSSGHNTVFVGDVSVDDRLSPHDKEVFAQQDIQAVAIMYLTVGNLRLGQILIYWNKPQTFTNADERLYGAIAQQASSVVYNRLLFNQTEEALSETAALYQASADLNTAQTFDEVLTALRQHTIFGQSAHSVTISFFDRPWDTGDLPEEIHVLARWGAPAAAAPNRFKVDLFPGFLDLLSQEELQVHEDVTNDERISKEGRAVFVETFNAKAIVSAPLIVGTRRVGFINGYYPKPMSFTEEQLRRLNVLTRQAAVTIQSIRLFEQTQEALAQTEALYTGSERIVLSSTEDDILKSLVDSTELRSLDRANIFMFDQPVEDGLARDVMVVAAWVNEGIPSSVEVGTRFEMAHVPFLSIVNPEESLVINDIRTDPMVDEQTRAILENFGMISFVMFPIVVGSQWLGMVSGQSAQPLNMTEVQMRQANSLVSQAAVVMQTTILFRHEQARARREHLLREIAAKVRSSSDIDTIMRTAVTEIGRTLGRRSFIKLGNGQNNDEHDDVVQLSQSQQENGAT